MTDFRHHALYRFFAHDESLLYVGITMSLPARLSQHRDMKEWWHEVDRVAVEHYSSREKALAAEKDAILAECPRYNVVHNGIPRKPTRDYALAPSDAPICYYRGRRHDFRREEPMWLYYEIHGDPLTDEYEEDEISALELWAMWAQRSYPDRGSEKLYGKGTVRIWWCVEPAMEAAPFSGPGVGENFLTYFTWPANVKTDEFIQWTRLPVADKGWGIDKPRGALTSTKGGFFQQATGWKPAPLQPFVDVRQVAAAARLWLPDVNDLSVAS